MKASQRKVREFWTWFTDHAPHFGEAFENEEVLSELDAKVTELGDFAWEVGPGTTAPNAFVLSPGGDRELLPETRAIVAAAPQVPGWELHCAKPPKQWEPRFHLPEVDGRSFAVDATSWRCVLLSYADGVHEVVVEAPNLESLPEDYRQWAAEIVIDGFLGECRRLEAVDKVTVVLELSSKESENAFPISEMCEHFG